MDSSGFAIGQSADIALDVLQRDYSADMSVKQGVEQQGDRKGAWRAAGSRSRPGHSTGQTIPKAALTFFLFGQQNSHIQASR
jgi:hypothetical protein